MTALERAEKIAARVFNPDPNGPLPLTEEYWRWLVDAIHRACIEHSNAELERKRQALAEVERLRAQVRRWNVAMSRLAAGSEFIDEPEKVAQEIARQIAFGEELGRAKSRKELERLVGPICKCCGVPEKQCDCMPTKEPGACS